MTKVHTTSVLIGRALLVLGLGILIVLFSWEAFSEELTVIEVHRNIPLADTDPVYKDFYINSGTAQGLKRNMVYTIQRKVSIKDATGTNTFGDLVIPVGQLKIIAVTDKLAVGREFKLIPRDDEPMLDQIGIMIGDQVDVAGGFIDKTKSSAKKTE